MAREILLQKKAEYLISSRLSQLLQVSLFCGWLLTLTCGVSWAAGLLLFTQSNARQLLYHSNTLDPPGACNHLSRGNA